MTHNNYYNVVSDRFPLGRMSEALSQQLEEEKTKVDHVKNEMEILRKKSQADLERAESFARSQRDSLERDLMERMAETEKQVSSLMKKW